LTGTVILLTSLEGAVQLRLQKRQLRADRLQSDPADRMLGAAKTEALKKECIIL